MKTKYNRLIMDLIQYVFTDTIGTLAGVSVADFAKVSTKHLHCLEFHV